MDLARLRLVDWVPMWKSVASRELASLQFTVLADQVCVSSLRSFVPRVCLLPAQ